MEICYNIDSSCSSGPKLGDAKLKSDSLIKFACDFFFTWVSPQTLFQGCIFLVDNYDFFCPKFVACILCAVHIVYVVFECVWLV